MENMKPFVKLFKTPLGYYCYDVNTFSMLKITNGVYDVLKGRLNSNDETVKYQLMSLVDNGYFSEHRPTIIEHPYNAILEKYLEGNIRKLTLQITQNCNLACKYCAYANPIDGMQRKHSNKSMSLELAKRAIDFLFNHSYNEEAINIGFYGGEPLLEFDKIKQLVEYANDKNEKNNQDLSYTMTTNATLLNNEMVEFLIIHKVKLLISLDGPREYHDKNRTYRCNGKGSFNDVIAKIDDIKLKYPEFIRQISIHSVLDAENDFSCYNDFFANYDSIKDLKVSTSQVNKRLLATEYCSSESYLEEYYYEKFKLFMAMLGEIKLSNVSFILHTHIVVINRMGDSFDTIQNMGELIHHGGPCIAGATRLFVDINGKFYPCERCSEKSIAMNIGNIDDGFNISRIAALVNLGKITEDECKNCWNIKHCIICATCVDNLTNLSRSKKLEECKKVINQTYSVMLDYLALHEFGYDSNAEIFELENYLNEG